MRYDLVRKTPVLIYVLLALIGFGAYILLSVIAAPGKPLSAEVTDLAFGFWASLVASTFFLACGLASLCLAITGKDVRRAATANLWLAALGCILSVVTVLDNGWTILTLATATPTISAVIAALILRLMG